MKLPGLLALAILLAGCLAPSAKAPDLLVGSTTSARDSGLFDAILPAFERATGVRAATIVGGTGEAIEKGKRGDVDVLLVHSPARERAFVAEGHGVYRRPVMYNAFLLVGPSDDPAGARGSANATEAFRRVAEARAPFASRGDESGTHEKERAVWRRAGLDPTALDRAWYKETGAGMAHTLLVANEKGAYTLTDAATWLQLKAKGRVASLAVAHGGDPFLRNQYGVVPVSAAAHPGVDETRARLFAEWLTGPEGQAAIAAYTIAGERAFIPNADDPEA